MAQRPDDEDLAYGDYHGQGEESDRGFLGDVSRRFGFGRSSRPEERPSSSQGVTQQYQPQLYSQPSPPRPQQQQPYSHYGQEPGESSGGVMSGLFGKLQDTVHSIGDEIKKQTSGTGNQGTEEPQVQPQTTGPSGTQEYADHRFLSFARRHPGNDVKWYVDACGYMWAVSRALEEARESIWILDWWLSPELYLRRPPAKFEQYRVDRMLQAAAERGVKVNIIVYKEVTQALTLSSAHTKHHLEDLHPNICVFRHPDHLPDTQTVTSSFMQSFQNFSLNASSASKLPVDALKTIYGVNEGTVLYWAHHEKLCLIDGHIAFMGGLDLCYGRWDTNQHSISDAHPGDLNRIIFPGQDYNNARIMDFQDVSNWQNNKLDRTKSSRMGWSDVSLCLVGPSVQDLQIHFVQRWNFIYKEKYFSREDKRYSLLQLTPGPGGQPSSGQQQGGYYPPPPQQGYRGVEEEEGGERGFFGGDEGQEGEEGERGLFGGGRGGRGGHKGGLRGKLQERIGHGISEAQKRYEERHGGHHHGGQGGGQGGVNCQICRSCAKWSHGVAVEHSIANAYIQVIRESKHFVYIENQFFITATGDQQKPVKNKIGAAIVERIVRAARNGENYRMIIMIPAVPAFAGDLKADDALGTRAIMEFQYNSINRGHGHSIYESIAKEGVNPTDYIRFYNLRNYDRINASGVMKEVEQQTGIPYDDATKQYDIKFGGKYNEPTAEYEQQGHGGDGSSYSQPTPYEMDAPYEGGQTNRGERGYNPAEYGQTTEEYNQYQQAAHQVGDRKGLGSGRWDSVAECYMLGGEDIRNVPWEGGAMDEIDAFVSEELYIHSKLLIADDRVVICGSANLNDRSQLGDHDSEIAIVIEDPTPVQSRMDGRPWEATKFAASLRRQIFRKHLGLIRPQDPSKPDENYEPVGVPQRYNWGSREDELVADPLSEEFLSYWNGTARTNTEIFRKVFRPVPDDTVRNWKQYDEFYERFFKEEEVEKEGKKVKLSKYKWGHVVAEDFPGGVQEVKEELSKVKGTLVEMPLLFLKEEDIAKEGLGLNAFTEEVYT